MYLKHLLHICCYSQVHKNAKMQKKHLFSVSLKDKSYSWQGGASSIQRVVGAKQSGRTPFPFPFKLGGRRVPEVSNPVSQPWGDIQPAWRSHRSHGQHCPQAGQQQHLTGKQVQTNGDVHEAQLGLNISEDNRMRGLRANAKCVFNERKVCY